MRRTFVAAGVALAALAPVAAMATAGWSATATNGVGAAKAQGIAGGNTPTASVAAQSVTVSWTASTLSGGTAVDGYVIKRYNTSNVLQTTGAGCSGTIAALTCTETAVPAGTWKYSVTPAKGTWRGAESARSSNVTVAPDTTAPIPALTFPVNNTTYRASTYNAGCTPTGLCGTVTDNVGVQTVSVSIKRNSSNTYWNGSAFSGSSQTFNTATVGTVGATSTTWAYGFSLPSDGAYTVQVQATDAASNTGSSGTSTFTVDTTAPLVAITKVNGSAATFPFTTKNSLTSIGGTCGTASGDGSTLSVSIGSRSGTPTCSAGAWTFSFTALSTEQAYTASASQSDTAGNSGSDSETVTLDKTSPALSSVSSANGGSTAGLMETGDTVTLVFNEALAQGSVPSTATITLSKSHTGDPTSLSIPGLIQDTTIDASYLQNSSATGAADVTLSADGKTVTLTVTSITSNANKLNTGSSGTITLSPATTLTDAAGNSATGSQSLNRLF